jgi:hypothetical protein
MPRRLVKKLKAEGKCMWIGKGTKHPVFTNSGAAGGAGKYGKFKDTRRTFVCHTGVGPSGWQKVYDINPTTGQKENFCDNYIWFTLQPHLITGQIIIVRSFAHVVVKIHAMVSVYVQDTCGYASASDEATIRISLKMFMKAHGNVTADMFANLVVSLEDKASASINCSSTTATTTTTVTTSTTQTTTTTPPPPSVVITSCDTLNQVPAGQPSGELFCTVNASAAGSFTVNPGIGAVSDCSGGSRQNVLTSPLVAGNNTICYYYYAPDDADQPPTDTLTYTAIVTTPGGTAKDSKSQTFKITYPIRTKPIR